MAPAPDRRTTNRLLAPPARSCGARRNHPSSHTIGEIVRRSAVPNSVVACKAKASRAEGQFGINLRLCGEFGALGREKDGNRRPAALSAFDVQTPAMQLGEGPNHRKAKPGALLATAFLALFEGPREPG